MPEYATDAPPAEQGESGKDASAPFGGMTPADAARRRWDKQRQADAAAERARREKELPDDAPEAVKSERVRLALWAKAMNGDVPAARELREWVKIARAEEDGSDTQGRVLTIPLDELTAEQRAAITLVLQEGAAPA